MSAARKAAAKAAQRPLGDVVDELGTVRAQIAFAKGKEKALADEILAAGRPEVEGRRFRAVIVQATRATLDMDAARRELGAEWCADHTRTSAVTSVRVSPRAAALAEAA